MESGEVKTFAIVDAILQASEYSYPFNSLPLFAKTWKKKVRRCMSLKSDQRMKVWIFYDVIPRMI